MSKSLPSKSDLLAWITANPSKGAKRDIAKAFGIKGAARIDLKRMLRELEDEGHLEKRKKTYRDPERLPPVSVIRIEGQTADGDLLARPLEWEGSGPEPIILYIPRTADPALGEGDRILAKLQSVRGEEHQYEARLIRRISSNTRKILGIYRERSEGGRIVPIDKGSEKEWLIPPGAAGGARDGELVEAEAAGPRGRLGLPQARITERLGDPTVPRSISLIAIHQHGIPEGFPPEAISEAERAETASRSGRADLTALPLITIDPEDARDHDDACCAIPDDDPNNPGGFVLWVAIADVAHYVTPGSALDRAARHRGNSTYFPDRVVPMLPEALSAGLCSLHEGVDRACLAAEITIASDGSKLRHRFHRGIMRSPAALSYEEAQAAIEGRPSARAAPLVEPVLRPLYVAYAALKQAREARQPLELDLPERRIELSPKGKVTSVAFRERFDAHRLVEEFMVLANVCAAETLIAKRTPLLFRVHEAPEETKLDALRQTAKAAGFPLAKGQVLRTRHLNALLNAAAGSDEAELINLSTLRSMQQAFYSPENLGHFGLALRNYAHFTSPIRRYADLVVHRALIAAHSWVEDGLTEADIETLDKTANHISQTERRSMMAERDTIDRYLAAYLSDRVGGTFAGRISGIARFGVFVKLDETGADGLLPIRELGNEYFHHDREANTLMGAETGREITVGLPVVVRLAEAAPLTGGLSFELMELGGEMPAKGPKRRPRRPPKRSARKVIRRRK